MAVGRIVDRAFGTFLRTRVLLALVVGVGVWIGLELIEQLGIATFRYQVTAAVLLGGLQLIPELGLRPRVLPDPAGARHRRADSRRGGR